MLKKRPENDRIYHEEMKILQHSYATLQQPQQIATIYNCYLEKQRNRHFGLWTPWSPLFIFYCQYSLTVLLLPNKEKGELHFIWRRWTTNNDNNRGFNIFMWYYIFSVKCQSICIWALILLYFNEILSMFSVIFMNFEAFWEGPKPKKNVKVCILR